MKVFEQHESNVRSYCRSFPVVFDRAAGAELFDRSGRRYLDFFAGAGALNYGHNDPALRDALTSYLARSGVVHSLDLMTDAKERFIEAFEGRVLKPRRLDYKLQFTGPTGTNCVEAALKLARLVTGRSTVVSFTNGFHGMTLGALAVTGNKAKRAAAGVPLTHAVPIPYDGFAGSTADSIAFLERMLDDGSSGVDAPAAIILETVQAEGGIIVGSVPWLRAIASICSRRDILLIVDDIQVGCGRTGPFFSFERAGIVPDIVCLSKSLSGFGVPFAMMMLRPGIDVWRPGEHNGTFRGFDLAFVTATEAIERYWADDSLSRRVATLGTEMRARLGSVARTLDGTPTEVRGLGMIRGLKLPAGYAGRVSRVAFEHGLIVETAGPSDEVLKLLPPLTIDEAQLREGLEIIEHAAGVVAREGLRFDGVTEGAA